MADDNLHIVNLLFGHLTPKYLIQELSKFHGLVSDKSQFNDMQIIISHIKYSLKSALDPKIKIQQQLAAANKLGFHFVISKQGQRLVL